MRWQGAAFPRKAESMNFRSVVPVVAALACLLVGCGGSDSPAGTPIEVNVFADPQGPRTGTLTILYAGGPVLAQVPFEGNSSTVVNAAANDLRVVLALEGGTTASVFAGQSNYLAARAVNYVPGTP